MQRTSFLLLNGGTGSRTKLDMPKQFHPLNGHPMLAYALIAARGVEAIDEIVMNYPAGFREETEKVARSYAPQKTFRYVEAGATRQESVLRMLAAATHDVVIVHEAARPVINAGQIQRLLDHEAENALYGIPIPYSIGLVGEGGTLAGHVERSTVLNIQLPQKFKKADLLDAHQRAQAEGLNHFTEDAMMVVEVLKRSVAIVAGWETNIKVTTRSDFLIVNAIMQGLQVYE